MSQRKLENICLISPKRNPWSQTLKIKKILEKKNKFLKAWYSPSLSILTIAGITPKDINVCYIDEDFEEIDFNKKYDLIAISAMTQQVNRGYTIANEFKKRGRYVVMGGIHASIMHDEALQYVDTVIVGEAENSWKEFLKDFKNNRPKKVYRSSPKDQIDLSKSPIPRYNILKGKNYFKDPRYFYNTIPIQVSRGCPHDCEFCLVTQNYGSKFRKKKIAQIENELFEIKKHFPGKLISFADDNLFVDRKYAKGIMEILKKFNVRWIAQSDISIGEDEELLELAYEAGGLFFLIGFESLNTKNLKTLNKNSWKYRQRINYSKNIERIQKNGILVFGSFIFGLDHDKKEVFKDVVEFMSSNHITGQLTLATPLPGSRMLERLKRENRLLEKEPFWDKCTFFDVLYKPKKMTPDELEEGFIWAYHQIFNEESLAKRISYMKSRYKNLSC